MARATVLSGLLLSLLEPIGSLRKLRITTYFSPPLTSLPCSNIKSDILLAKSSFPKGRRLPFGAADRVSMSYKQ